MNKKVLWLVFSVVLVGSVVFFAACGQASETSNMSSNEMPMNMDHDGSAHNSATKAEGAEFSNHRNEHTGAILDAYSEMKKGLDADNKAMCANGGASMVAALEKFDGSKIDESKRKEYNEIFESAKEHAEHIVKSEIGHQKEHFQELTTDLKDFFAIVGGDKKASE